MVGSKPLAKVGETDNGGSVTNSNPFAFPRPGPPGAGGGPPIAAKKIGVRPPQQRFVPGNFFAQTPAINIAANMDPVLTESSLTSSSGGGPIIATPSLTQLPIQNNHQE